MRSQLNAMFASCLCIAVALCALAPVGVAHANTGKVEALLKKSGSSGVVRGPHTISKDQKAELQTVAGELADRLGARVYFVLLPKQADNDKYVVLYKSLGMKGMDLLAVSNGSGLALRCNALPPAAKAKVWSEFRDAPHDPVRKFAALADAVAAYMPTATGKTKITPADNVEESTGTGTGTAIFVVLLIAAVAAVIVRRKRRDAAILGDYRVALDPVETDLTDMYLSMDGLEEQQGFDSLLGQVIEMSDKLDVVKTETPNRQAIAKLKTLSRDAAWLKDEMAKLRD